MNDKLKKYEQIWKSTKIYEDLSSIENAVMELQNYFGIESNKVRSRMINGGKMLADEWNCYFRNRKMEYKNIIEFYDNTINEIFELMFWHCKEFPNKPLQYVFALDVAKRRGYKRYLDYGSGVGTAGILFAKNDFQVTLADISSKNLDFCRFRFKDRNLTANFIDLKNDGLEGRKYDFITCLDVLEHIPNPIGTLMTLRSCLADGGLLIVNVPFGKDEDRPMHIVTDVRIADKIRALGFSYDRTLANECKKLTKKYILVLKKVDRSCVSNKLYLIYDSIPMGIRRPLSKVIRMFVKE